MKRFCQECGHEAKMSDNMCTNCGTKLIKIEVPQQHTQPVQTRTTPPKEKKPMSKRQKIIIGVVSSLAILLIGFSVWANIYFSKDSTEKRFFKALEDRNAAQLVNMMMHEDGSAVTQSEADAFIKLVEDISDDAIEAYVSIEKEGKFLGIFQSHKVSAIDQYAYYDGPTDGVKLKFNSSEVNEKKEDDGITYGPLIPGIYTVEASLNNDFGESKTDIELELSNPYSEDVWMDELPIGEASVYIWNYDSEWMADSFLLVNDHQVEIDEYGDSEYFGPVFLDGSAKAKVVVNYPWGEVTSKSFSIDSNYIEVDAPIVSDEELEKVKTSLLTFGEEMQNAKAQLNTDIFTGVTDIFSDDFLYYEIDPLVEANMFYSARLNKMEIDSSSMWIEDGLLMVHTLIDYSYAFYGPNEEVPSLEDDQLNVYVGLQYDNESKNWLVSYLEPTYYSEVEAKETLEGSGTVYAPDAAAVSAMETSGLRAELQAFMKEYTIASVDAINYSDFNYMKSYLTTDGSRYKEAKDYIAYLKDSGISEEFVSTAVVDVVDNGDGSYNVKTVEEFIIYYPDSEEAKTFETICQVKLVDGSWKVHQLISTTEI
nr:hypothetical protein [Lysinibacillus timonensis]